MQTLTHKARGFTLLELIIVIAILAILSVAVVLVINPAETLRRARDSQRLSDLSAVKSAIGLYMTDVTGPDLDAAFGLAANGGCLDPGFSRGKVFYSIPNSTAIGATATTVVKGADVGTGAFPTLGASCGAADTNWCRQAASVGLVNGTGWTPVDLTAISGGSPLASYPIDPSNSGLIASNMPSGVAVAGVGPTLAYRYACVNTNSGTLPTSIFEIDAILESNLYSPQMGTDGGDNTAYYEGGTSPRILGTGTNY